MRHRSLLASLTVSAALVAVLLPAAASASTVYPGGWSAYPGQATVSQTSVQQPINADGSSNFKATRGVIPVKFALATGTGPFVFASYNNGSIPWSWLSYAPSPAMTIADITSLSAVYAFTTGNCYGGSLRWEIDTASGKNLFVYYGTTPNFTDCNGTANQSAVNLLALTDSRVDTSQFVGGTFYDTWAHALTFLGSQSVDSVALVLDGGWGGDQVVSLTSATVNTNTFIVPTGSSAVAPTCNLPGATIKITRTSGAGSGSVNETTTIQPNDTNGVFRVVDCKYMYNLDVSSLSGVGIYKVEVLIGGVAATGPAFFELR